MSNKNKIPRMFAFDKRIPKEKYLGLIDPEEFSLDLNENYPEFFTNLNHIALE